MNSFNERETGGKHPLSSQGKTPGRWHFPPRETPGEGNTLGNTPSHLVENRHLAGGNTLGNTRETPPDTTRETHPPPYKGGVSWGRGRRA